MYFLIYLSVLANLPIVTTLTQKSVLIKKIQSVPSVSSKAAIDCGLRLLKGNASGVRLAEGTDNCEILADEDMLKAQNLEPGFGYFTKKSETVRHLFAEGLLLPDAGYILFYFSIHITNNTSFGLSIFFNDEDGNSIFIAEFTPDCVLMNGTPGPEGCQQNLFSDKKVYMLEIDISHHYFVMYTESGFCYFSHDKPNWEFKEIKVEARSGVSYLPKAHSPHQN